MSEPFEDIFRDFIRRQLPAAEAPFLTTRGRTERRALQRDQIMRLLTAERAFQANLVAHPALCREVYGRFLAHVRTGKGLLSARPYFRERQEAFTVGRRCCARRGCRTCRGAGYVPGSSVGDVIRSENVDLLATTFRMNALFVMFVMASGVWSAEVARIFGSERWWRDRGSRAKPPKAEREAIRLASDIIRVLQEVLLTNLSLAVERSGVFWRRTPAGHLSRMDLLHHGVEGLTTAVDKLVLSVRLPEGGVVEWDPANAAHGGLEMVSEPGDALCATAVRRMTGNFIENYSATSVHFMPDDRRRLYRANKAGQFMYGKVVPCGCDGKIAGCEMCGGKGEYRTGSGVLDYDRLAQAACETRCKDCLGRKPACATCGGVGRVSAPDAQATPERIASIMAAASCRSLILDDGTDESVDFPGPEEERPDMRLHKSRHLDLIDRGILELRPLERKLLIMSGVNAP